MENKDIRELLDRYLDGTATRAERHLVESHYHHLLAGKDGLASREQLERATKRMREAIERQAGVTLSPSLPEPRRNITKWLPYAAAAILLAAITGWWAVGHQQSAVSLAATEILPGGNRATLTLADGRVITLSEEQTGITVGGQDITYDDGVSSIVMLGSDKRTASMLSLTTPKGGQYQITLPDGSKVWLNASSTLKYPDRFPDGERLVEIVGEGYFEIEKDPKRPFKVRSEGQVVDVLGTAFNISAYPDDPETKTTLVTGKVRVVGAVDVGANPEVLIEDNKYSPDKHSPDKPGITLTPGEQGITRGEAITTHRVDVSDYTDWKNGEFVFREETVQQAMRRLARWYDVEVRYAADIPEDERFSGAISRYDNLGTVLQIMEEAGAVGFEINGRNVLVRRKNTERIKNE